MFHGGSSFFIADYKDIDLIVCGFEMTPASTLAEAICAGLPGAELESTPYDNATILSIRLGNFNIVVMEPDSYNGAFRANEVLKLMTTKLDRSADACIADKDFRVALNRIIRDGATAEQVDGLPY